MKKRYLFALIFLIIVAILFFKFKDYKIVDFDKKEIALNSNFIKAKSLNLKPQNLNRFLKLDKFLFPEAQKATDKFLRTHSLLIAQGNEILFEKYTHDFKPKDYQQAWSMTKSIFSLITMKAIENQDISLNDSICKYLQTTPNKCAIKIEHLLSWSSGLKWQEKYEEDLINSNVIQMLYGPGRKNMGQFSLNFPLKDKPGEKVRYSSGDSNLLSLVLRKALGSVKYNQYYNDFLSHFKLNSTHIDQDHSGSFVASSYLFSSPRDLFKISQSLLQQNTQYINAKNLKHLWTAYKPSSIKEKNTPLRSWWRVDFIDPQDNQLTPAYCASGHWGQFWAIVPKHGITIVRFANDRQLEANANKIIELSLEGILQ